MPNKTTNYGLTKPLKTENYDIEIQNSNMDLIDKGLIPYVGDTAGTPNAFTVSVPSIANLSVGMAVSLKIHADSTGASTLNINNLGAKAIKKTNGTDVTNLKAGGIYTLRYDGTNFILQGEGASGNATASDLLLDKTATTDAGEITGTMPNNGAVVVTPGTTDKPITKGYHDGNGYVQGDADLISSNIKAGANIFGVPGSPMVMDTSDGTIDAGKILTGYDGYSKGFKYNGSMPNIGQQIITPSTVNQNIVTGYHNGAGYVKGEPKLLPGNIPVDMNFFGVQGIRSLGQKYATGTTKTVTEFHKFQSDNRGEVNTTYIKIGELNLTFTPRIILFTDIYKVFIALYIEGSLMPVFAKTYVRNLTDFLYSTSNPDYIALYGNNVNFIFHAWE